MLKLHINKFMLRHEGRLYTKGDSVILPDDMAKALAEHSPGAYSLADAEPAETVEDSKPKAARKPRAKK